VDNNGNNRFDAGDTLIQMGDAYRDDNENGSFDNGEFVLPRFNSGICSGSGRPVPARANTCDNQLAATVRKQTVILFSSSRAAEPAYTVENGNTEISFKLKSLDNSLLPMPAGTTVTATVVDKTPDNGKTCSSPALFGSPVANVAPGFDSDLSTEIKLSLKDCENADSVTFTVTSPSGVRTVLPPPKLK
jgi:hypothetical protein